MAKKSKKVSPEAEDMVGEQEAQAPEELQSKKDKGGDDNEMVTINVNPSVKINGKKYSGRMTVPRHVAQSIIPSVEGKIKSDIESITGKSYLVQKIAGHRTVVETKD
jgi:hypothetical protein